jgi:FMN phosphatase YigB (HAD superfamily)
MIQPKAVIFDLGKVLLDFDYRIAGQKLAARSNKAAQEFTDLLLHPHILLQYETGLMSEEEFFQAVCKVTGYGGNFSEFSSSFGDIFTPIEPMIALQAELRQKGYPTYIFSNTNQLAVDHVRKVYPFFANFNGYVFSFEHRCMKPNPGLYEAVEKSSGRSGPELLYLDDRLENIEAGSARAWQTILHETPEKTRAQMEILGMLNQDGHQPETSTC